MIEQKPFDTYFGGKAGNGTIQTLINHIPPHTAKIVPFAGNDALTRFIKPASDFNIIADIDTDVINAWSILGLDNHFVVQHCNGLIELTNLADSGFWQIRNDETGYIKYRCHPGETFIFLDPPYLIETIKADRVPYVQVLTTFEHQVLLKTCNVLAAKGYKLMICCIANPMYEELLSGWHYLDYDNQTRQGKQLERIYFNYELTGELHDYSFVGTDFREREKFKRIKTNLIKKIAGIEPLVFRNKIKAELIELLKTL